MLPPSPPINCTNYLAVAETSGANFQSEYFLVDRSLALVLWLRFASTANKLLPALTHML